MRDNKLTILFGLSEFLQMQEPGKLFSLHIMADGCFIPVQDLLGATSTKQTRELLGYCKQNLPDGIVLILREHKPEKTQQSRLEESIAPMLLNQDPARETLAHPEDK